MAGQLPRYPSQDKIARATSYVPLQEAIQYLPNKFYFSKQEIVDNSPSRKDGIDYEKESELRKLYCSFLQELGIELRVPQVTIATALMLCHRFYMRHSHAKNDWQIISTASMFLACKAEETPRWLTDVTVVAYKLIYRWDPSAPRRIRQKEVYDKQKDLILTGERLLLSTVAFDLNIEHPYKSLVAALKRLDISHKELAKVAWNFVNDWLRSELCLQYKPHYIAAGSLFLAAKYQKVKLPTEKGKVWWMEFDVSPKQLEEVIQRMLSLLEKNRTQALPPPVHGDTIKTKPAAAKEKNDIPHPAISNDSTVTHNNVGCGTALDGAIGKSVVPNNPQSRKIVEPHIAQCTPLEPIKCAMSSNIQQPGIIADAERPAKSAVSSSMQSDANIVNHSGPGLIADAGEPLKSAASSSPQSCVLSSSNVSLDAGHGVGVVAEGLVESAMSKCTENESASDNGGVSTKETVCCQTSDCGSSAVSVTEDSNSEQKQREINKDAIYFEGGNRKIDVNRIKEALKRRRGGGTVNKKITVGLDDEIDSEAWIERELEDGIQMEAASGEKRRKL